MPSSRESQVFRDALDFSFLLFLRATVLSRDTKPGCLVLVILMPAVRDVVPLDVIRSGETLASLPKSISVRLNDDFLGLEVSEAHTFDRSLFELAGAPVAVIEMLRVLRATADKEMVIARERAPPIRLLSRTASTESVPFSTGASDRCPLVVVPNSIAYAEVLDRDEFEIVTQKKRSFWKQSATPRASCVGMSAQSSCPSGSSS